MAENETILRLVENGLKGSRVELKDTTGTQDHFELRVVSSLFRGKNLVQRHRMVYQTLGNLVGGEIHALSLTTMTPEEEEHG